MIETERLYLRLMKESDTDDMLGIFNEPKLMKAFGFESFSREQMIRWVSRNLQYQEKYGYGLFSVILKSNGKLIGDCGLECTTFEGNECIEIGYDFSSVYWNQGYATEAASAVRDFSINDLNIDSRLLCSFIRKINAPSIRVSQKIGMKKTKEYSQNGIEYYLYQFPPP
ncbi:MAG: GNAT family N-acetyltransferase [Candidatus Thermoplasmatota archaeon]|nr:GNAT family N-acetyltransferase [Euryarchaeota archaeon]MBU4032874.1 GNAT family N-acetyltransferase [Candidatus Thermoplasmatota archaeon]MBU4072034.1 GNAT family N-acetyltransferase [Candidatus Thermoplasmatota archaeon]MBU4144565.1 GNAT family N-acetyltransferase [Candidatus Thermoplasmatota archaeon]MBU4592114.1 GNAT family N-acetyltransferase [Candidatus Thermoplasmatota archaeon]